MSMSDLVSNSTKPCVVSSPAIFFSFAVFPSAPMNVIDEVVGDEQVEEQADSAGSRMNAGGLSTLKVVNEREKSQPPSDRRRAIRMCSPGLRATRR